MVRLNSFFKKIKKYKILLIMLLPAALYTFIFSYLPMGGIVLAFKNYNYRDGIFGSPWNGFQNFRFFFQSGQAFKVTRNTILYNLLFLVVNTTLQVTLAILISEMPGKRYKRPCSPLCFCPISSLGL